MLKRLWLFLLVSTLLLSFSACGKTPEAQTAPPAEQLVTNPITLIETDSLVLRVLKIDPENEAGYTISVMVSNQTDIPFNFIFDDFSINDLLYGETFNFTVEPGQKELKRIVLTPDKLKALDVTKITKVDFHFYGMDTEFLYDSVFFEKNLTFYPLGEAAYKTHSRTPLQSDVVLFDNAYCSVTFLESFTGETDHILTFYVENKTQQELVLVAKDTTLNGTPCSFQEQLILKPGKKEYAPVFISIDTLAAYGITEIETYSGQIEIYDQARYSDGPLTTVSVSVK